MRWMSASEGGGWCEEGAVFGMGWSGGDVNSAVGFGKGEAGITAGEVMIAGERVGTVSLDTEFVFRMKAEAVVSRSGSSEADPV